jgi:hypothetical protein
VTQNGSFTICLTLVVLRKDLDIYVEQSVMSLGLSIRKVDTAVIVRLLDETKNVSLPIRLTLVVLRKKLDIIVGPSVMEIGLSVREVYIAVVQWLRRRTQNGRFHRCLSVTVIV